jgi:hypothetical protein
VSGWVVLTVVGFVVGALSGGLVACVLVQTDGIGLLELAEMLFGLLLGATVLGTAQWLALRWILPSAWAWIPATALGFAALVGCSLFGELHSPWPIALVVGAVLPGALQAQVLRVQLPGAAQWMFSSAFGLLAAEYALSQAYADDEPWWLDALLGAGPVLPYALLTGWTLLRLAKARQEAEEDGQRVESDARQ